MDQLDNNILRLLKQNSRIPFLEISKKLKVSEGTIRKRVNQLQKDNIIKQFTIKSDYPKAMVGIETNPTIKTEKIVNKIKKLGMDDVYEVTGRFDILCTITTTNHEELNKILEKIFFFNDTATTEIYTVLKEN